MTTIPAAPMITMTKLKSAAELTVTCSIIALVIALIDFVLLLLFNQKLDNISFLLSILMLSEGGVVLVVGGAMAFFSPLAGKMEEVFFHSEPWNASRQKEAEKQARTWIVTGSILVITALLISAL